MAVALPLLLLLVFAGQNILRSLTVHQVLSSVSREIASESYRGCTFGVGNPFALPSSTVDSVKIDECILNTSVTPNTGVFSRRCRLR